MAEYLIKNRKKYKKTKLARGLDLSKFDTKKRDGETGISCKPFGNVWFQTPKGDALFKTYDGNNSKIRILNELLYNCLGKKFGVKVAEYEPAHKKDKVGLVSYNFVKENQRLISLYEIFNPQEYNVTYKGIVDHFELYRHALGTDIDELEFDLFKVMVLDALTFQEDRHNNLNFLYDEKEKVYKLAPVFDNELAFAGSTFACAIDEREKVWKQGLLFDHGTNMHFLCDDEVIFVKEFDKIYQKDVERIVALAQTKPTYKIFLENILKNFDINEVINQVEKMGYSISPNYIEYLNELTNIAKQTFRAAILKLEKTVEKNEHNNSADINTIR